MNERAKAWLGWGILAVVIYFALTMDTGQVYGPGVAVVEVKGVIAQGASQRLGTDSRAVAEAIDNSAGAPDVRGLLLDINSPGGTVGGSQEIYFAVRRFRATGKPVHAFVGEMGASGAYYVAAGAGKIAVLPTSLVGSIGVIWSGLNWSGLMGRLGVADQTLIAGESKDVGSSTRPMTNSERRLIQDLLDEAHATFIADVAAGRDTLDEEGVRALATGWVWSGSEGVANGLADTLVEGWQGAMDGICAEAGLEPGCPALSVMPEVPWYETLLPAGGQDAASLLAEALAIGARPMAIFRPAFP